jgi:hypothetical protein
MLKCLLDLKNYNRLDMSLAFSLLLAMRDPNWNARFGSPAE